MMKKIKKKGNLVLTFFTILSLIITGIKLGMRGVISAEYLVGLLFLIVVVMAIKSVITKVVITTISLILFSMSYAGNDIDEVLKIVEPILALAIMFFGVFIIVRKVFRL